MANGDGKRRNALRPVNNFISGRRRGHYLRPASARVLLFSFLPERRAASVIRALRGVLRVQPQCCAGMFSVKHEGAK